MEDTISVDVAASARSATEALGQQEKKIDNIVLTPCPSEDPNDPLVGMPGFRTLVNTFQY
jgi:hypothetical protein